MKYKTLSSFAAIAALLFSLSSCRAPKDLEYRDFKNLSVPKIGFGSTVLKVDLVYYNPNNFGLQLKTTDLDIYVDNNFFGHSSQDYQISIPKRGEFTLPIEVQVDMKNAFRNVLGTLLGKEVLVRVEGRVKIGKANVFKSFPVKYESVQKFNIYE
jgi:LEA14-like dessication related protein